MYLDCTVISTTHVIIHTFILGTPKTFIFAICVLCCKTIDEF